MSTPSSHFGLTEAQVLESRQKYGVNVLTPPEKEPLWRKFLGKFEDPIIIILIIAGLLSVGVACWEYFGLGHAATVFFEPMGILMAIFLSTGIAFYFEVKADRAFAILNQVNDDEPVRVIREGNTIEVPRRDIVVGDLVVIGTGEEVAADGELLEAISLKIDESTLTGEPICEKSVRPEDFDEEATFATNAVMKGTKVMEGHGLCRITAVGDATENGKVFEAAQIDDSVKTPLNEQLDSLGAVITKLSYVVAVFIIVGRLGLYFYHGGASAPLAETLSYGLQTLMIAVALIVVSVPEGLPMAVTLSLAYSMRRMLKTNNLVRKMHACETMGATTVICTDKTGTLTQNQMRVHEAQFYALAESEAMRPIVYEGIAVNSTASLDLSDPNAPRALGNPTEGALLLWLRGEGQDYVALKADATVLDELPFSTERKYMATVVRSAVNGRPMLYVKGAPEIVRALCTTVANGVDDATIEAQLLDYQHKAMRTLGFACQELSEGEDAISNGQVTAKSLTFLGITAIADPVRTEVPDAIRTCISAGIAVKIVTGDTIGTATEIGRQVGLWQADDTARNIITGPDFAALSDEELEARIHDIKIIARARPLDKKRLVETLQKLGDVVAVTGDGTNDAPALKAAHVGLSMGDGTSVAKEASDITIIDSSFSSITRAVMWGRSLYQNIQRFLLFQLTVNVTACLIVLVGGFIGTQSPLTVTQMLWVNLIMDTFAAMALASLPPSESVMNDKPRPRTAFILVPNMRWRILGIGGFFFVLLLGLILAFNRYDITSMTNLLSGHWVEADNGLSRYELSLFFSIFVFLQFWNMFNARAYATGRSAFHFKGCSGFVFIAMIILFGQIGITTFGGQMFSVMPLSLIDWLLIIGVTSAVMLLGEITRSRTS